MHVGLGRDLLVDVGLGGDLFVHVRRQGGGSGGKTKKNLSNFNLSNLFVGNKDASMRSMNEWFSGKLDLSEISFVCVIIVVTYEELHVWSVLGDW